MEMADLAVVVAAVWGGKGYQLFGASFVLE